MITKNQLREMRYHAFNKRMAEINRLEYALRVPAIEALLIVAGPILERDNVLNYALGRLYAAKETR